MAVSVRITGSRRIEFSVDEVTGAVGDSLTVLPIVVALALLTEISLPHVLVAFGVFQIVWGVWYGLPVSVEPMKALAALAIAGALSYAELALAGLVLGVVLLAVGYTGALSVVERWIGEPVVRGIQFAVGLLLLETGVSLAAESPPLAAVGLVVALVVIALGYRNASALVVLGVGAAIALGTAGVPAVQSPGLPPVPALGSALTWGVVDGIVAQFAMTIGNAALATSLLFSDLFDREVPADVLAGSMGVTNLLAVPLGGIPMCHGCDGVAGKYEFGARTGGANVILGIGYLALALVATGALVAAFPVAMLGVLLALVAISLGSSVRKSSNVALSVGIGLLALVWNVGIAFALGICAHLVVERYRRGA
ncbi:putative sulfate/molybdate transporter [Halalkalicoccus jeotgali]|uniref:Sulfate transporter n=1 Tax=Halalkalicoccus jeotgali (strain DSM 18796 / CECT 7217 / JCM 14584 / KCTC 4019 / B3) TaxID=795797 RepID=D8J5J0_HALJB|nr:putative sulfate/molybdate transporter [Halalkalicoccus jeotgali]ADJ15686.1 sulphate transporter [Halalkalicoccus jeotgali B3]ELY36544.1 sulfate transporter [Halalkalicoccus jeotgali B3]